MTGRGYQLVSFENVLGRPLRSGETPPVPDGVEIRRGGDDELDAWIDVVVDGFAHPDDQGVPSHEDFPREIVERAERDIVAGGRADLPRTATGRCRRWAGAMRPSRTGSHS